MQLVRMSMSVTWSFHVPKVTFRDARLMVGDAEEGRSTNSEWDPRADFHAFLDRYAPTAEALAGENARSVGYFRMWQIELRPWSWEEKKVQHADGQDVDISTASVNELYVHRVNAINFLWAW